MNSGSRRVSGELVRAYNSAHEVAEGEVLAVNARSRVLMQQIQDLSSTDRAVLICGETGTGKTLIAHELHARNGGSFPLHVINCAALSDALLVDLLEQAHDTAREAGPQLCMFLDEIGELSPWGQAVLLRKLQNSGRDARVRLIAATHRDLDRMITQGTFSRELLWRLNMARLLLAPLRDRRDEIIPLALHFLKLGLTQASTRFVSIGPELLESIERYDWPGNVRELKNAMFGCLAVNESGTLGPEDLPDSVRLAQTGAGRSIH